MYNKQKKSNTSLAKAGLFFGCLCSMPALAADTAQLDITAKIVPAACTTGELSEADYGTLPLDSIMKAVPVSEGLIPLGQFNVPVTINCDGPTPIGFSLFTDQVAKKTYGKDLYQGMFASLGLNELGDSDVGVYSIFVNNIQNDGMLAEKILAIRAGHVDEVHNPDDFSPSSVPLNLDGSEAEVTGFMTADASGAPLAVNKLTFNMIIDSYIVSSVGSMNMSSIPLIGSTVLELVYF